MTEKKKNLLDSWPYWFYDGPEELQHLQDLSEEHEMKINFK